MVLKWLSLRRIPAEDPLDAHSLHRRQSCHVTLCQVRDDTDKDELSLSAELEEPQPAPISTDVTSENTDVLPSVSDNLPSSRLPAETNILQRHPLLLGGPQHLEDELDLSQEQRLVMKSFHSFGRPKISIQEPESDTLVRFSTVTIREYPITAGDNPSTTRGVPLTVEWNHEQEYTLQVNDFEDVRPSIRRSAGELQTPSRDRFRILTAMGWNGKELIEHIRAVDRVRGQRLRTRRRVQHLPWLERLQESWEKIQRGVGNATLRRRYKQWERQWLEQYR